MFLQHLPSNVRLILAVSQDQLSKIAEMADRILEISPPAPPGTYVAATSSVSGNQNEELLEAVRKLQLQVATLSEQANRQSHRISSRGRGRSRSHSRTRPAAAVDQHYCWYHNNFGQRAKKCLPPCTFQADENQQGNDTSRSCRRPSTKVQIPAAFLYPTGIVFILPPTPRDKSQLSEYKLYVSNGFQINTYGQKLLQLDLGLRRSFKWPFIIADVDKPIIGADFLKHFNILVDICGKKLIDITTSVYSLAEITYNENVNISTIDDKCSISDLLLQFKTITNPLLLTS